MAMYNAMVLFKDLVQVSFKLPDSSGLAGCLDVVNGRGVVHLRFFTDDLHCLCTWIATKYCFSAIEGF